VHLSPAGERRVTELRQEIADAVASILPSDGLTDPCPISTDTCTSRDDQLSAKLDALTAELEAVVNSEVQAAGVTATGTVARSVHDARDS